MKPLQPSQAAPPTLLDPPAPSNPAPLVEAKDLRKTFVVARNLWGRPTVAVKAVDGVSFAIQSGETLGLVGESGCGKSTVGRVMAGLYKPTSGQVLFHGEDFHAALAGPLAKSFRQRIQMVFQDPFSSLNPRMTIGDIIAEPLDLSSSCSKTERADRIADLLRQVGLDPDYAGRFPHEFSGGQRQRVGLARALAAAPEFIICDEPVSALDVSVQAQIINLLGRLQDALGLTYLFIAHNMAVVKHISNRIAVMYLGTLVETAPRDELFVRPAHPYTQALLSAVPIPDPAREQSRQHIILEGDIPSPLDPPSGCRFRTRCRHAMPVCAEAAPPPAEVSAGHIAACHLFRS